MLELYSFMSPRAGLVARHGGAGRLVANLASAAAISVAPAAFGQDGSTPLTPSGRQPQVLALKYVQPAVPGVREPTEADVGMAIAKAFPPQSKYIPLRVTDKSYASISVSAAGTRETGLLATSVAGVRAKQDGSKVTVEYIKGRVEPGGRSVLSISSTVLTIQQLADDRQTFVVRASDIEEKIGRDMLVFKQQPLDAIDNIRADVDAALARLRPTLPFSSTHTVELDVQYPPPSIYANFEREFGKNTRQQRAESNPDIRHGWFNLKDDQGGVVTADVQVAPHRNGSKVIAKFSIPYELNPDGTSTFRANAASSVTAQLTAAANR